MNNWRCRECRAKSILLDADDEHPSRHRQIYLLDGGRRQRAPRATAWRVGIACQGFDPAQTLSEANRFLRRYDPEENATALFALLNTRQRSLVFANAGHPPPLMAGPCGTLFLKFSEADLPLGIEAELLPAIRVVSGPAGTLFVLYTDGVSERERNPLQGEAQLHDAARFAYKFSTSLTATVIEKQMLLTGFNHDDAAILTAWTPLSHVAQNVKRRS